jgi:glycosyltransferase involved in cell wall biosynthesis
MVVFSYYPADPRPRRAAETLTAEGMAIELICLRETETEATREVVNGVDVRRVPLRRRRGGTLGYLGQYGAFLLAAAGILAVRSLRRRYDLVYVHNMPDVLVLSALVPRLLGAKVILDLHDPMPELMTTIFGLDADSARVRVLRRLERWSIGWADQVLTVNAACKRLFASRSCAPQKVHVVMNSPDEAIFGFHPVDAEPAVPSTSARPFVIMYHGSMVERNGLDLAVDAVARVRRSGGNVELRIYGASTPFLEQVMASARAHGLDAAVRYLGPKRQEEIGAVLESCDLGIIPNHRNRFTELNTPTRIFEYLAAGKPVVAPRTPGILDYFDDNSLVFFEPGDAEDLARGIEQVLTDPRKAQEKVRRAQEVYRAHAWRQEREVLVELVANVLSPGSRAR